MPEPKLPGWMTPDFNSKRDRETWRRGMAKLISVEPSDIDDWTVEQFMRWVTTERHRIAGTPQPAPAQPSA